VTNTVLSWPGKCIAKSHAHSFHSYGGRSSLPCGAVKDFAADVDHPYLL